jgi:hypothetical protein
VVERDGGDAPPAEEDPGWPVGFMIFVALAALYLGWRLVQLVARGLGWLF